MKNYRIESVKDGIYCSEYCNNWNAITIYAQHLYEQGYSVKVYYNDKCVLLYGG